MGVPIAGRGPELVGTLGLFIALTTITIALRIYCRLVVVKNFGLDDYLAVAAWVLYIIYSAFVILGAYNGTGQHAWDIPLDILPVGLKWWWACEPVYILSMMMLKASICLFLLRIAVKQVHKIIIWTVFAIHELYSFAFLFIFIFQCYPSEYFWTQYTGGKGKCMDPKVTVDTLYAFSAISCAGDWILGILPAFMVAGLQMNRRTKISVACILAVGAIASSATIVRFPYISSMSNVEDFLYATLDVAIWSTVEIGIGITASAAATLRPLFRVMLGSSQYASGKASQGWGDISNRPSGYVRSRSIVLRSDIGKGGGTTATIRAGDEESFVDPPGGSRRQSSDNFRGDSESDEWRIVKTTKMTQTLE